MDQQQFLGLLSAAVQHKVSDIHLHEGMPPAFRMKGDLVNVKHAPLTPEDFETIYKVLFTQHKPNKPMDQIQEFDGSFEVKGLSRFRYNLFRMQGKLAAVLRIIPAAVPSIEKLNYPPVLRKIAEMPRGLVLVTGATGSGKSTTLAAMIDHINSTQPLHILTIEDPIEFLHPHKLARLSQREVGPDTGSFANALRAALRQDPDVILVGEMRDAETIDIALKAAETGHLVFSTVHTTDAVRTIGRLVSVFPPEEQRMVRLRLADNLMASISQRLVKRLDGNGLVAVQEIMISNTGIAECIADPDLTPAIRDFIIKSCEITGGQTFDQHLVSLYKNSVIDLATAKEASTNASDFERNLMYADRSTDSHVSSESKRPDGAQGGERQSTGPLTKLMRSSEEQIVLESSDQKEQAPEKPKEKPKAAKPPEQPKPVGPPTTKPKPAA